MTSGNSDRAAVSYRLYPPHEPLAAGTPLAGRIFFRDVGVETDITEPTLIYWPVTGDVPAARTAVIICPGGGYGVLAVDHEGAALAAGLPGLMSAERRVDRRSPPAFLVHAADDALVPVENSLRLFGAMQRAGLSPLPSGEFPDFHLTRHVALYSFPPREQVSTEPSPRSVAALF